MIQVDAGIDHGDDHAAETGGHIPGFGGIDVGIHLAAALTGVLQAPLRGEAAVVGDQAARACIIWFGIDHRRVGSEIAQRLRQILSRWQREHVHPVHAQALFQDAVTAAHVEQG